MNQDPNSVPPWNTVGKHAVFPQARHDEVARFNFLTNLNAYMSRQVIPGNKVAYEKRAKPRYTQRTGHEPRDRKEVREAMRDDSHYQIWSALRRNTMEMRQQAGRALVLRQIDTLIEKADKLNHDKASLQLDPNLPLPPYVTAVDTHCMPGSYHTELKPRDISAGANYDAGLFVTTAGLLGRFCDGGGQAIVEWLQREHAGFKPERVLDMGCTVGHNVVPIALAFPQAEVIAVDVSAPVLRYAHARAQSLGAKNITFMQKNAEQLDFADESFDLITTSMFLHELSEKSLPRIIAESYRLLKPGGLVIHLEQPQYTEDMDIFEQFMRDWDAYNNNEPFWSRMHELDLDQILIDAGFKKDSLFQISIAASVDETLFPKTDTSAESEDYGRTPAWNAFCAWKK